MTAAIFFVIALAVMAATAGRRDIAVGLFGIALVVSVAWFNHHMTAPLGLSL